MHAHVNPHLPLVLLFDADCGLCVATTRWLERRVPPGRLRALPLGRASAEPSVRGTVRGRDLTASLHVVLPDGSVRTGAGAVLAAGRLVPRWGMAARALDHRPGRALLEPAYRLVARHRVRLGRMLGLPAVCGVPRSPRPPRSPGSPP